MNPHQNLGWFPGASCSPCWTQPSLLVPLTAFCPLQVLWGHLRSGPRLRLPVPGADDLSEEAGLAALAVGAAARPAHPAGRGQPAGPVPHVATRRGRSYVQTLAVSAEVRSVAKVTDGR